MKKITKKFITYYIPGTFFPETSTKQVDAWDIPHSVPKDCYGFSFHEVEYAVDGKGEEFVGKSNKDKNIYFIGEIIHHNDIPDTDASGRSMSILKSNIQGNSPTHEGIKCRMGNWQCMDKNVVVVAENKFKYTKGVIYS